MATGKVLATARTASSPAATPAPRRTWGAGRDAGCRTPLDALRLGRGDEADSDGVERRLRPAHQPQLAEDAAHVGLDGLLADAELARDLLVGLPHRNEPQHVGLALGELLRAVRRAHLPHQPRLRFGSQLDLPLRR